MGSVGSGVKVGVGVGVSVGAVWFFDAKGMTTSGRHCRMNSPGMFPSTPEISSPQLVTELVRPIEICAPRGNLFALFS